MHGRAVITTALGLAAVVGGCGRDVVAPELRPGVGTTTAPNASIVAQGYAILTSQGPTNGEPLSINDAGQVATTLPDASRNPHAFVWIDGVARDIGTLGGQGAYARAINNSGQVVGQAGVPNGLQHAFIWENGAMKDLGTGGVPFGSSVANGINDKGHVTGYYAASTGSHAMLWRDGEAIDLGTLGGASSVGMAVNDADQVVGYSQTTSASGYTAFLWQNGVMTALPTLGPGSTTQALDINNRGEIVGTSQLPGQSVHPVLWKDGSIIDLAPAVQFGRAYAINENGDIAGYVQAFSSARATLWQNLGWGQYGMNTLQAVTGGNTTIAMGMNNTGNVIGLSYPSSGPPTPAVVVWQIANDQDGDLIPDTSDNCPIDPNPDQSDLDKDGKGNPCDPSPLGPWDLGGPYSGIEGSPITFAVKGPPPIDDPSLSFGWWFDDGNAPEVPGLEATHSYSDDHQGPNYNRIPFRPGVDVYKDGQWIGFYETGVALENAPPVVTIAGGTTVRVDEPLDLLATFIDPGTSDSPWSFALSWDGAAPQAVKATEKGSNSLPITDYFSAPGTHTLTVTVTDKDGGVGSATATITVLPNDPGATQPGANVPVSPVDPATGTSPVTLQFANVTSAGTTTVASASQGPPLPDGFKLGNPPTYYDVSTTATFSGAVTLCFTYPEGTYQNESKLKLMHREASGTWVDVTTSLDVNTNTVCGSVTSFSPFVVAQQNQLPVVFLAAVNGREGSAVHFTASAYDPDETTLSYLWNFGDGATSTDAQPSHTYVDDGSYAVSVVVTDADGGATRASSSASIENVAPSVHAGAGIEMLSGQTFTLNGSFSDPGINDAPWAYDINWGDGRATSDVTSVQGAITRGARYLQAGSYTVSLQVTDKNGGAGTSMTTVVVRRIPVTVDIKPGSSDNPIKLADLSDAQIPVAVLSTASFDATTIDAASVSLASVNVSVKKNGSIFASKEDVNGDGRADLVLHFARADLVANGDLTAATTSLSLFGNLADGRQVGGSDVVRPIQ